MAIKTAGEYQAEALRQLDCAIGHKIAEILEVTGVEFPTKMYEQLGDLYQRYGTLSYQLNIKAAELQLQLNQP